MYENGVELTIRANAEIGDLPYYMIVFVFNFFTYGKKKIGVSSIF